MAHVARTREKGKIAHGEWPKIVSRYSSGETIASIGREYGCTAPAIRYIIKRSGMLKAAGDRRPAATKTASPVALSRERGGDGDVLGAKLRKRVSSDLATFLVALDHVVAEGSIENLANLQDATDFLMRSVARTRMEVERLLAGKGAAAAD
jgi:hypothetical protein